MDNKNEFLDEEEEAIAEAVKESLEGKQEAEPSSPGPDQIFVIPLTRRPFFPGMAAPVVIEPGPFYEVLKLVAKTEHKCMGLFLTKQEEVNVYKIGFGDLYKVGVLARILRIIPMEQGGAQVVLNMEKRISIKKPIKSKYLRAEVKYHEDATRKLTKELKAYSISIITTIKELLKLNPLFKEELQIFLSHSDFTEPGKLADFAVALTTAGREELQDVLETFDLNQRIDKALLLLKKELDFSKLQSTIKQRMERRSQSLSAIFSSASSLKRSKKSSALKKKTAPSTWKNSKRVLKSVMCPKM